MAAWREKEGELVIATLTACENIRFSSLFVAGDVLRGEERGAGQLQLRLWNWNSTSLVAPRGLSCQICPSLSFPPRRQSAPESLLAGVQNQLQWSGWKSPVRSIQYKLLEESSPANVRESKKVLGSEFYAVDSGLQVLDCGIFVAGTWIPDSNR